MSPETETFVGRYLKELRDDNAAVFIGAGLSKAAGFVDWAGLLDPLARELGLDAHKEHDLVGLAQYYLNHNRGNRHHLTQVLIDHFSDVAGPTDNHKILARLPIKIYWTANYDRLIEKALELSGKRVDVKYVVQQLSTTKRGRDAIVYKMHGDVDHSADAVLTKDDYEAYHLTHGPFTTALSGQLVDTTFLFLGFSFTDPNLDYILSRVRSHFQKNQHAHYCITKRRTINAGEDEEDYRYAARRQQLVTDDLMRFNINTVFIEKYEEITLILRTMENRYRRRAVFISGSAVDYGSWGREATEEFLVKLAGALIDRDHKINSGFGLGIGGAIVNGAVQHIYSSPNRSIEDQLLLRPFPLGIKDATERQRTYDRFRQEMIAQAGIALFIMGNKRAGGGIVSSDGVRAEFEIAKANGLYVVPVGASGFTAEELWKEVMASFKEHFAVDAEKIEPLMNRLGVPVSNPIELIEPILQVVSILSKE